MYFKIKWWQLIPYEIAVLSLGIVLGAYWHYFFSDFLYFLLILFMLCGGYTMYMLLKQISFPKDD